MASLAVSPFSDNVTVSAWMRFVNLKSGDWVYIVVFSKTNVSPDFCMPLAFMVTKPLSDASRSQMRLSINCRCSGVIFFALMLTEYGFITVVANAPIRNAPTKNGRAD